MEDEIDERRRKLDNMPISKLQQELQESQLQLRDAERRNEALAASRDHFKGKVEELCRRLLSQAPTQGAPAVQPPAPTEGQLAHVTTESAEKAQEPAMAEMLQALRKMQDHLGELSRDWGASPSGGLVQTALAPAATPPFGAAGRSLPAFEVAAQ